MSSNGYVTADKLFSQPAKRRFTEVEVGEHKFRLQSWTSKEAQRFVSQNAKNPRTVNERLIVMVCVDGEGNPVFGSDDIERLQNMDAAFVAQLAKCCLEHVGLDSIEDDEDAEKN